MMYEAPPVGAVVTVVARFSDYTINGIDGWRDYTWEQMTVLPNDPFDKPGTFCIPAVDEPYITKRNIAMERVTKLIVHNGKAKQASSGVRIVNVAGSNSAVYQVTVVGETAKSCTCLGFTYRKNCRHLFEAVGKQAPVERKKKPIKKKAKA